MFQLDASNKKNRTAHFSGYSEQFMTKALRTGIFFKFPFEFQVLALILHCGTGLE